MTVIKTVITFKSIFLEGQHPNNVSLIALSINSSNNAFISIKRTLRSARHDVVFFVVLTEMDLTEGILFRVILRAKQISTRN